MAANKVTKVLTPYNFTNKNDTSRIRYIVIHYVGALGGAKQNCQYYASRYVGASAHYFVGFAGEVYQSVEDGDIAWHCGAASYKHPECRNSNSIGIEMCVRKKDSTKLGAADHDWYFEKETVESAVALTKKLMKKYKVTADRVIRHNDVTGKLCPNPYVFNETAATWAAFKKAVSGTSEARKDVAAAGTVDRDTQAGNVLCQVRTTCDILNIRAGAGTKYRVTGAIAEKVGKKNIYKIMEEKNGWGRLKSGAGWISLAYTKKL